MQEPAPDEEPTGESDLQAISEVQAARLSQCQTLDEIKEWIRERGYNPRTAEDVGIAVLDHISDMYGACEIDVAEVAAYICDPTFHSSATSYIVRLIGTIMTNSWDTRSWAILRDSISTATELGLIGTEDLRRLIHGVLDTKNLSIREPDGPLVDMTGKTIQRREARDRFKLFMVAGILESLDRSAVLQITDLGPSILPGLFRRFAAGAKLDLCQKMIWRLLPWAPEGHVPLISRLTVKSFRCYPAESDRRLELTTKQTIIDRLTQADPNFLQLLMVHTTERLLALSTEKDSIMYKILWQQWYDILATLGSKSVGVSLKRKTWEILRSQIASELSTPRRLLGFAWTAMSLWHDARLSDELSDRLEFLAYFDELVASFPECDEDFLNYTVIGLSELAVPHKTVLSRHITRAYLYHEDRLINSVQSHAFSGERRDGISESILTHRIRHAHFGHSEDLADLLHDPRHGVPDIKILMRRMIHESPLAFGIVCHLLETDKMIGRALEMPSLPSSDNFRSRRRDASATATLVDNNASTDEYSHSNPIKTRTTTTKASPSELPLPTASRAKSFTRAEVVDLINSLAVSFATSPVATPRAALRRVHWCFIFLSRYKIRVEPIITRALWHAGVTRYGEQGTSATYLRWILWRIGQVEGPAVAQELLWNENVRRVNATRMEQLKLVDAENEESVLAKLEESAEAHSSVVPSYSKFSTTDVEAVLTGDSRCDREIKKRLAFLDAEPQDVPFFVPGAEKAREEESKMRDDILKQLGSDADDMVDDDMDFSTDEDEEESDMRSNR